MIIRHLSAISIALVLLVGMVFAGCQKKEEPAPEPAPVAETAPPVAEPAAAPAPEPAAVPEKAVMPTETTVLFATDSSDIDGAAEIILDLHTAWLTADMGAKISIEGNCDERGSSEYNITLGQRRSDSVRDYLVSKGIAADRIATTSSGEENPTCTSASTEACWALNRNAVIAAR